VDGVIANFRKLFVDCCNEANGTEFTTENTGDDWSYTKSLGLSREDSARTWEHICHHGRANDMELLPGALFGVETLIKTGHAVYFVTSPVPSSSTWCYDRRQWLSRHFGVEAAEKVVFTNQKHLVRGDVFVDDKPENVRTWEAAFPENVGVVWMPSVPAPDLLQPHGRIQFNDWTMLHDMCRHLSYL
jgi:5'(3')-deoxyribonucleotidase